MDKKLYIRKIGLWILFDHRERTYQKDFEVKKENRYGMTYNTKMKASFSQETTECEVLSSDIKSKLVTSVNEYLEIAQTIKANGLFLYNKKLGKAVPKK